MTEYLIDTSVLVDLYKNDLPESAVKRIETHSTAISIMSFYEIAKYFRNQGKLNEWNRIKPDFTKYKIIEVNPEICETAAKLSNSRGLSALDALIYSTALQNEMRFLTRDSDFKKMEKTEVI